MGVIFKLDTNLDYSKFSDLERDMSNLSSAVSGYKGDFVSDSEAPWTANVASAFPIISNDMNTCSKRIENISKAVKAVVDNHNTLQSKYKFRDLDPKSDLGEYQSPDGSGGSGNDGSGNGGSGNGGSSGSGGAGAAGSAAASTKNSKNKKSDKKGQVETDLTEVGYVYLDEENLSDESIELFNDSSFRYDDDGFARMGDRYVVTVDESVGNVGDVLRFSQKTGEAIECVIGVNTFSDKYKNTLNFVVNKESIPITPTNVTETIISNNLSVNNIGTLSEAGSYTYDNPDGVLPASVDSGSSV